MSISTPFIRRPIATPLLAAAVFLVGLAAYPLLPVASLPNVEFPTLSVSANYPGASPATMGATVATPLETEFGQLLPGLSQMAPTSELGSTQIALQFGLNVDINSAATLVLEAINAAEGSLHGQVVSRAALRLNSRKRCEQEPRRRYQIWGIRGNPWQLVGFMESMYSDVRCQSS